jgi:hypothetical protein
MIEIKSTQAATVIEQVTSLVLACAWPFVVIVFIVVFREQIAGLIKGLEEWSAFGTTLKIRRDMNAVERKLEQAEAIIPVTISAVGTAKGSSTATAHSTPVKPRDGVHEQHATSPAMTGTAPQPLPVPPQERILRSWQSVQDRVTTIAQSRGFDAEKYGDFWQAVRGMNLEGGFTPQILGLLAQLRKLGDEAARGGAASSEDADRYNLLVRRFLGLVGSM